MLAIRCQHPALDGFLEILGQASIAAEPSQGPFHDPSSGHKNEPFGRVRALDDLHRPGAELGQCFGEFRPGVAAIGEDVSEPREGISDRSQQRRRAVTVLDVGGVDGWRRPATRRYR